MTAKHIAEAAGVKLVSVAENAGYTTRALRAMAKANPKRLEMLCNGQLMLELRVDPHQLKELKGVIDKLKGE